MPGVIAVNTSLILGNRLAGVKGAVAAGAGVILPSLIVIVAIAAFFSQIQDNFYILQAFSGIRARLWASWPQLQ